MYYLYGFCVSLVSRVRLVDGTNSAEVWLWNWAILDWSAVFEQDGCLLLSLRSI